jgi:hypothetical protein
MARKVTSDFNQLLTTLRRIIVLGVAAFGLARGWPYESVALRGAILWAVLYFLSMMVELLFQYLGNAAMNSGSRVKSSAIRAQQTPSDV